MIKRLLVVLLVSHFSSLYAQTIKTDVLVIGGSPSGVAAAIQAARSKATTVFVADSISLGITAKKLTIEADKTIPSGIWGEFRGKINKSAKTTNRDTTSGSPLKFYKATGESVLRDMTDSVKNLTVEWGARFFSVEKSKDGWIVMLLKEGKKVEIKARVIIDATENGMIVLKAGAKYNANFSLRQLNSGSAIYRAAIAAGDIWLAQELKEKTSYGYWFIPLNAILANGQDNLLVTQAILPYARDTNALPAQLNLGQGAGAAAAYCAFFKTTTANLKVRIIQGELLDFKACLVPFTDVDPTDPDWRAIQQIGVTGLLKGQNTVVGFSFMPAAPVTTAEIEPVLTEIYTRAFLWFRKEKPGEKFTISNMLSLISDYTLTDPVILKSSIQRAWKTQFRFKDAFDVNRQITRREFAVLANKYLNPFARTVDLDGRLVN